MLRIKERNTFSIFVFLVLLILQCLTLLVVIGVLHAMLISSFDQQYQNEINTNMTEFRYYLKDRHGHVLTRLDELCTNNSIKIALMLRMNEKISDVVNTSYPSSGGITYYVRTPSDRIVPSPLNEHRFLDEINLISGAGPGHAATLIRSDVEPTMAVFTRSIFRREKFLGLAIGIYDLAGDRHWFEDLQSNSNYFVLRETSEGLSNIENSHFFPLTSTLHSQLSERNEGVEVDNMMVFPLAGHQHLFWAADISPLSDKKRDLLTKIVFLVVPMLCLALTASYLIVRKITAPLKAIADDAREIVHGSSAQYLEEKKIKHTEFLDLAKALNKTLRHIQHRNDQLLLLNHDLQKEIAERRQLSDALAKSEKQYRTLQENIPIGLFRTTIEGEVIYANPYVLNIFRFPTLEEFKTINVADFYEQKSDRQYVLDQLHKHGIIEDLQVRLKRRDGSLFWASFNIKKATDPHIGTIFLDGTLQDINQQIEVKSEKQRLEDQLRQAHKLETIGTLAGGIAHDFNNILASITGYTELALEDSQAETIQEENLKCVLIAAQRATELVRQILTFARQTDTDKIAVNVHLIVDEAIQLLRSTIPSTIKVERRIKTTASVLASPSQLHQIIVNLCSNATHAMQTTGGVLTIDLSEIDLEEETMHAGQQMQKGKYIKLRVEDTGHGMSEDIARRVFDPYFTTKNPGEGTGIGLSVVQGIVRAHGGLLTVESKPDHGTVFEVYLPRIVSGFEPQIETSSNFQGGNERILLVDDEKHVALMVEQLLKRLGYRVTSSSNGSDAYDIFSNAPDHFDLVLTDLTMPGLTGDLLAKKIHSHRREIPILLWTGYNDRVDPKKAAESGISEIVYKPLSKSQLARTIRQVLDAAHNAPTPPKK